MLSIVFQVTLLIYYIGREGQRHRHGLSLFDWGTSHISCESYSRLSFNLGSTCAD